MRKLSEIWDDIKGKYHLVTVGDTRNNVLTIYYCLLSDPCRHYLKDYQKMGKQLENGKLPEICEACKWCCTDD